MNSAPTKLRWLAFMLAVFCVGAIHHSVCNGSAGGRGLLWWFGNGNTWLLSLMIFQKALHLSGEVIIRLLWPALGYLYYTIILLPVFESPFDRDAKGWAKAAILPAFHTAISLTAYSLQTGFA